MVISLWPCICACGWLSCLMRFISTHSARKYPFIRLLAALIAGIMLQWYLQVDAAISITGLIFSVLAAMAFARLELAMRFRWYWLHGICILCSFMCIGALLTFTRDIRNQQHWYGHGYTPGDTIAVIVQEPPEEKANSFKAIVSVTAVSKKGVWAPATGKLLAYFSKENQPQLPGYGSVLLLHRPIQPISNSGNPGAFDYVRYCLFQQITGQVYLKPGAYTRLPGQRINPLQQLIFSTRDATVRTLKRYIPGEKEQSVASALLIGYRHDLDKDLVQAYSNTGVVHIIAISGLHLGMIYGLLIAIFAPFKRYPATRWIKPVVILVVLWGFALVAGAAPSIIRSAVMFTFIVVADAANRRTNMYNTLAAAAFCMLVYNPYILWDVGFQLSYTAVISIVTFMMPVYRWLCFRNIILDKIWAMTAVTISAQVFTLPVVLFYFHQFPNFFLITNFVAVPLSGLVLYTEILLVCLAPFSSIAAWLGMLAGQLLHIMNGFIEAVNTIPFAVWDQLQFNVFQVWMLFGFIIAACIWLLHHNSRAVTVALLFAAAFTGSLAADHIRAQQQHKLIVYNVPRYAATDILQGKRCTFIGDTALLANSFLRNFHIRPGRILHRAETVQSITPLQPVQQITVAGKTLVLLSGPLPTTPPHNRIRADILVLSHNPRVYISELTGYFDIGLLVADSSNPLWKTGLWKKDCENLHLRFHSTAQQGAFVMDL